MTVQETDHTTDTRRVAVRTGGGSVDIAVVGAGLLGCATAYHLARAGARVLVVEGDAVAAGASGRNSGAVEHPYDEAQRELYADSVAELRAMGVPLGEEPAGVLLVSTDPAKVRDVAAEMGRRFPELAPELLEPDAAREREPELAPGAWACALRTGYPVPPDLATRRYAEAAIAHGASVREGAPAALAWRGERCIGVDTADGRVLAEAVVVCAGAATAEVVDPSGGWRPVRPVWGVSVEVDLARPPAHVLLEVAVARAQAGARGGEESAFGLITAGGRSVLGSTFLPERPAAGAWQRRLLAEGRPFVPALAAARAGRTWICARPRSADGRPLLGPLADGLFVATGHGGRGITTGAASGRLAARAVLEGGEAIPEPLRAERFPLGVEVPGVG